jgi:hypothetical protein
MSQQERTQMPSHVDRSDKIMSARATSSMCEHTYRRWHREGEALVGIRVDHCVRCGDKE